MKELPLVQCCAPLASVISDGEADELAAVFGALADPTRVKIVSALAETDDAICVCDFELGLAQPTVSYHLKRLAEAGLVERERRGTFAYYRLAPGALERLRAVFAEPAVV